MAKESSSTSDAPLSKDLAIIVLFLCLFLPVVSRSSSSGSFFSSISFVATSNRFLRGWMDRWSRWTRSSNWRILDFFSSFFGYLFFFFFVNIGNMRVLFFCISFFLFSFFTSTHREIDVFSFFFFFTRTRVCWFVFATLLWLVSCMEFTKDLNLLLIKFTLIFKKMGYFQYIIFRIV